jgi:glycosyltransferase involved in cell wall biosynthesis
MLSDVETKGGAAIAASRLAEGLSGCGLRVTRLVASADGRKHDWNTIAEPGWKFLTARIARRTGVVSSTERWMAFLNAKWLDSVLERLAPDIINVHNFHGALERGWKLDWIDICMQQAPIVWTLHDMWSFTGRCAYSYDCRKFLTGCDSACPTATESPILAPDQIAGAWDERRRLMGRYPRMAAVTPSRWLAQEAQAGLWGNNKVTVIPYGIPLDIYRPVDQTHAREVLGINARGPVLLVAAQKLTDRRKGMGILAEALQQLASRSLTILTLGAGDLRLAKEGVHLISLGYIDNEETKVLAYNAADVLVHPAPVDNFPNVVVESVACGTPVVSFAIGGLPDIVRPQQTGWLADVVSPAALARAIDTALNDIEGGKDMRKSCRATAEAEYGSELQARRYLDVFLSLNTQADASRVPSCTPFASGDPGNGPSVGRRSLEDSRR